MPSSSCCCSAPGGGSLHGPKDRAIKIQGPLRRTLPGGERSLPMTWTAVFWGQVALPVHVPFLALLPLPGVSPKPLTPSGLPGKASCMGPAHCQLPSCLYLAISLRAVLPYRDFGAFTLVPERASWKSNARTRTAREGSVAHCDGTVTPPLLPGCVTVLLSPLAVPLMQTGGDDGKVVAAKPYLQLSPTGVLPPASWGNSPVS